MYDYEPQSIHNNNLQNAPVKKSPIHLITHRKASATQTNRMSLQGRSYCHFSGCVVAPLTGRGYRPFSDSLVVAPLQGRSYHQFPDGLVVARLKGRSYRQFSDSPVVAPL